VRDVGQECIERASSYSTQAKVPAPQLMLGVRRVTATRALAVIVKPVGYPNRPAGALGPLKHHRL
jgi:hypothetical protein